MCTLVSLPDEVDKRAFQDYFNLPFAQRVFSFIGFALRLVEEGDFCAALNDATKVRNGNNVVLVYLYKVIRIEESKRQNTEIDEILPVNSGKALNDNNFYTKISGCDGCMLPA